MYRAQSSAGPGPARSSRLALEFGIRVGSVLPPREGATTAGQRALPQDLDVHHRQSQLTLLTAIGAGSVTAKHRLTISSPKTR
jgi:hypothetical protein